MNDRRSAVYYRHSQLITEVLLAVQNADHIAI